MLIQRATHLLALVLVFALVLGAGGCGDDASGADAGPPDGGADAQIDGGNLTPAHCRELGPLPGWAAFYVADGRLLARCQGHDLHAAALEDGMMCLSYVVTDGAVPGRSWAITAMPPPPAKVYAGGQGGDAVLCTEHLAIRVSADTCRVVVWDAADTVLLDDGDDGGWLTGTGLVDGVPKPTVSVVRQTPTSASTGWGSAMAPWTGAARSTSSGTPMPTTARMAVLPLTPIRSILITGRAT